MDFGISGKVALVTAASKGLGRGTAQALSVEGCRVAICSRTTAEVEQTAREIAAQTGHEVAAFTADMSQAEDISALLEAVKHKLGDPEILVCNAGGPPPGNFANTSLEQYQPALDLSLMSSVRLTHGVVPAMKEKGWGRIVMISSISVKQPIPFLLLSNMARAGLAGFMKTAARELAASGITINAALPGTHETDRVRQTALREAEERGVSPDQVVGERASHIPAGRLGTAEEFGALAAFLCSQQAAFITGANIQADGGVYGGLL